MQLTLSDHIDGIQRIVEELRRASFVSIDYEFTGIFSRRTFVALFRPVACKWLFYLKDNKVSMLEAKVNPRSFSIRLMSAT